MGWACMVFNVCSYLVIFLYIWDGDRDCRKMHGYVYAYSMSLERERDREKVCDLFSIAYLLWSP
jgi:hypothetical protein